MTKLTSIINLGIEKGFDCFGLKESYNEITVQPHNDKTQFTVSLNGLHSRYHYSLNDLIFSPESNLMQALFGEELVCKKCGKGEWTGSETRWCDYCRAPCSAPGFETQMPAYEYHQQQLLPLDDQERISYLANALGVE